MILFFDIMSRGFYRRMSRNNDESPVAGLVFTSKKNKPRGDWSDGSRLLKLLDVKPDLDSILTTWCGSHSIDAIGDTSAGVFLSRSALVYQ